ncbi:hypothetical protein BGZ97_010438 [Linnemannia gamsii]|uniref:Uncharacterized protein n=1 Tax=Linnemannia gamsii TaxID=64522 RepID=A0A9P6QKM0_9FUNG|nr:hypothetical protein BGZ97_010438 [Linnemannia gamsii]
MPKCLSCQRAHHRDKYVIHASVSNMRHTTSGLRGATGVVYFHDGTHINWHDASITKDVAGSRRAVALFRTWLATKMHD